MYRRGARGVALGTHRDEVLRGVAASVPAQEAVVASGCSSAASLELHLAWPVDHRRKMSSVE